MNILLIGAGQLGSRHLQSIADIKIENVHIDVIDPSDMSLEVAKTRYIEVSKNNQNINFYKSIMDTQNDQYDIAIIATNSNVRALVIKELLSSKVVKNMILEKVLFQKEQEYFGIEQLLQKNNIKTWVNHPKRTFPFYKKIRKQLEDAKEVNFHVSVGNWGLACNVLHLLDTFEFLTQKKVTNLDLNNLDTSIVTAKREGYLEVNGLITGKLDNYKFQINHFINESPMILNITSDVCNINIDERNGFYTYSGKSENWKVNHVEERTNFFQSELTKGLVEDIYFNDNCDLPTYKDSMELHLKCIVPLQEFINSHSEKNYGFCPIT